MSSGGLVTGLSGLSKTTTFQWYGWPGLEVPKDEVQEVTTKLKDEFNAVPVFMEDDLGRQTLQWVLQYVPNSIAVH